MARRVEKAWQVGRAERDGRGIDQQVINHQIGLHHLCIEDDGDIFEGRVTIIAMPWRPIVDRREWGYRA